MRTLTEKQKTCAERFLAVGNDPSAQIDIVQAVYNTKNRNTACTMVQQLKGNERFQAYLKEREQVFNEVLAVKAPTLSQLVEQLIPRQKRIETLKEIIETGANRERLEGIKEVNLLLGEYAPTRSINVDYELGDKRRELIEPD